MLHKVHCHDCLIEEQIFGCSDDGTTGCTGPGIGDDVYGFIPCGTLCQQRNLAWVSDSHLHFRMQGSVSESSSYLVQPGLTAVPCLRPHHARCYSEQLEADIQTRTTVTIHWRRHRELKSHGLDDNILTLVIRRENEGNLGSIFRIQKFYSSSSGTSYF
jgi:hypothetical protein